MFGKVLVNIQPKSDQSIGLTISLMMRQHSNRKVEGKEGWRVWGTLWGRRSRGENEVEIKWKMVLFTKNALCQSWKRIDKEKRKRREKKEWKSERLINGQPQSNRGILLYIKIDTAYHLSGDFNTNENTSRSNNSSLWLMVKRWRSDVSWVSQSVPTAVLIQHIP